MADEVGKGSTTLSAAILRERQEREDQQDQEEHHQDDLNLQFNQLRLQQHHHRRHHLIDMSIGGRDNGAADHSTDSNNDSLGYLAGDGTNGPHSPSQGGDGSDSDGNRSSPSSLLATAAPSIIASCVAQSGGSRASSISPRSDVIQYVDEVEARRRRRLNSQEDGNERQREEFDSDDNEDVIRALAVSSSSTRGTDTLRRPRGVGDDDTSSSSSSSASASSSTAAVATRSTACRFWEHQQLTQRRSVLLGSFTPSACFVGIGADEQQHHHHHRHRHSAHHLHLYHRDPLSQLDHSQALSLSSVASGSSSSSASSSTSNQQLVTSHDTDHTPTYPMNRADTPGYFREIEIEGVASFPGPQVSSAASPSSVDATEGSTPSRPSTPRSAVSSAPPSSSSAISSHCRHGHFDDQQSVSGLALPPPASSTLSVDENVYQPSVTGATDGGSRKSGVGRSADAGSGCSSNSSGHNVCVGDCSIPFNHNREDASASSSPRPTVALSSCASSASSCSQGENGETPHDRSKMSDWYAELLILELERRGLSVAPSPAFLSCYHPHPPLMLQHRSHPHRPQNNHQRCRVSGRGGIDDNSHPHFYPSPLPPHFPPMFHPHQKPLDISPERDGGALSPTAMTSLKAHHYFYPYNQYRCPHCHLQPFFANETAPSSPSGAVPRGASASAASSASVLSGATRPSNSQSLPSPSSPALADSLRGNDAASGEDIGHSNISENSGAIFDVHGGVNDGGIGGGDQSVRNDALEVDGKLVTESEKNEGPPRPKGPSVSTIGGAGEGVVENSAVEGSGVGGDAVEGITVEGTSIENNVGNVVENIVVENVVEGTFVKGTAVDGADSRGGSPGRDTSPQVQSSSSASLAVPTGGASPLRISQTLQQQDNHPSYFHPLLNCNLTYAGDEDEFGCGVYGGFGSVAGSGTFADYSGSTGPIDFDDGDGIVLNSTSVGGGGGAGDGVNSHMIESQYRLQATCSKGQGGEKGHRSRERDDRWSRERETGRFSGYGHGGWVQAWSGYGGGGYGGRGYHGGGYGTAFDGGGYGAGGSGCFEIDVQCPTFKFSCAHFVAYRGFRERLHGHNYRLKLRLGGMVGEDGYVMDFSDVKGAARIACKALNEYVIVPMRSDVLDITEEGQSLLIRTEDQASFTFPKDDCAWLEVSVAERSTQSATYRAPLSSLRHLRVAADRPRSGCDAVPNV